MPASFPDNTARTTSTRLDSIDLLRGAIMILMSLDHVRDYFTHLRFTPEDITQTWTALFVTRWVTHFCAPLFFLLAGLAAFLSSTRGRSPREIRHVLWTRGLWLVLLELTVVGFAWSFLPGWSFGGVIWALGWSMVILSLLVRLPVRWIAVVSVATILLHNLLDPIRPEHLGASGPIWGLLHVPNFIPIVPDYGMWFDAYVLVPWFAVMSGGYALGPLYRMDAAKRRRVLTTIGLSAIALFVVLRATNLYGNPVPPATVVSPGDFHRQATLEKTIILFFDPEKYPPSLQFLLMTLGPGLLALAALERIDLRARGMIPALANMVTVFGRVPLFYYVLHIFPAHLLTVPVALVLGQPWDARFIGGHVLSGPPPGYGLNLTGIYVVWILVNALLFFPCSWFARYKQTHRQPWLTYV